MQAFRATTLFLVLVTLGPPLAAARVLLACGETEGGPCCPPPGSNNTVTPYPLGSFCTGPGLVCVSWAPELPNGGCKRWPRFPSECGGDNKPCCPSPHDWAELKEPPPSCQVHAQRARGGQRTACRAMMFWERGSACM